MPEYEIEAKFKISDPKEIRKKLRELGAVREGVVFEKNVIFDDAKHKFAKDKLLRLRRDKKITLTYKGPVDYGNDFKKRKEINLEVKDVDRLIELLAALGYFPDHIYEKKRETWYLGKATIEIDLLPKMGFFLEIEGDEETIRKTIQQLGLDENKKLTKSYYELWQEYLKENNMEPEKDMIFENSLK